MKKKVFFVLSSLTAGGSERVFWLISQNIDKNRYEVFIVLLDSTRSFFSTDIEGVHFIDLKTIKASYSFFKFYSLCKKEKPYAVFATGGHINTLVAVVSYFIKIPCLVARPTNVAEKVNYISGKAKMWGKLGKRFFKRFDNIICQSEEILNSTISTYHIDPTKIVVIPNPVVPGELVKLQGSAKKTKKIITIARLTKQKGLKRLLDILSNLPKDYFLTIAGDGPLRGEIEEHIRLLGIEGRVSLLGLVKNIPQLIMEHDVLALSSYIEGFPNVAIEALSVGVPVVSFKVGGISEILINDFNGYIVEQGGIENFKNKLIEVLEKSWDAIAIKQDITERFGMKKVVGLYEKLIEKAS